MTEKNELYQTYVKNKLVPYIKNHELYNTKLVDLKVLAMASDLGTIASEAKVFCFWDKSAVESAELKESYLNGLKTLIAIGYEIRVDAIKSYREIPQKITLVDLFFKLYQDIFAIRQSYSFKDYEDAFDDYLTLGFLLGFDLEEISASLND